MINQPGQLALMGETLGAAVVSVEGGGMWLVGEFSMARFLVEDGDMARTALEDAGMEVAACHRVLVQRLDQDEPGRLGEFCPALADAGANIEAWSDHDHPLVVEVDDHDVASVVSDSWVAERSS